MSDNIVLRSLFTLPPIISSTGTALVVPELPPKVVETGDREVDAVLWLQQVVRIGNPALIEKALASAKAIKTPMKVLGDRYAQSIIARTGNTLAAAFGTLNFGDLEAQAKHAMASAQTRHEAMSRFGSEEAVFAKTPAEQACINALQGLNCDGKWGDYREEAADARFLPLPDLVPHTLDDCLHARDYWDALYALRNAWENNGDHWPEVQAHDDFAYRQLAVISPRSKEEALRVLDYVIRHEYLDRSETPAMLRNLIRGPGAPAPEAILAEAA